MGFGNVAGVKHGGYGKLQLTGVINVAERSSRGYVESLDGIPILTIQISR